MQVDPLAWTLAVAGGRLAGTRPLNLFLTLGKHRRLFPGWLHFAGSLMPGGRLPRRDTELVVLRVAHLCECEYERVQHARIARWAGLTDDDQARIEAGPDAPGWEGRDRAILTAVDSLLTDRDMDDTTWDMLRKHLGDRECIELCLLAGHYAMLAATIKSLRIQTEDPV